MKKKYMMFLLVFIITLGYAAVSTKVELIGKTDIKYNEEDSRVEITNIKINNNDNINSISEDKQSFTFIGSGNEIIEYTVTNYSYQYDVKINLVCNPSEGIEIEQIGELKGQSRESRKIISTSATEVACTISIEKISRTEYADEMKKEDLYIIRNAKEQEKMSTYYQNHSTGKVTYNQDYINFLSGTSYVYSNYITSTPISLEDYNYVHFNGYISSNNCVAGHLFISTNKNSTCISQCSSYGGISNGIKKYAELYPNIKTYTIDITDLDEEYFIGFLASNRTIYIKDLWLSIE